MEYTINPRLSVDTLFCGRSFYQISLHDFTIAVQNTQNSEKRVLCILYAFLDEKIVLFIKYYCFTWLLQTYIMD